MVAPLRRPIADALVGVLPARAVEWLAARTAYGPAGAPDGRAKAPA